MEPRGHFVQKGAVITAIEASIYESRRGSAESNVYSLLFDNGEKMEVKANFIVNLESIEVKGEDDEGQVILGIDSNGSLKISNEKEEAVFDGTWHLDAGETQLKIYNNIVTKMRALVSYSGAGANGYTGHAISGQMRLELTGFDESGIGIFEIFGEGIIQ